MLNSKTFSDKVYSQIAKNSVYNDSKLTSIYQVLNMLPKKGKVLDIGCFNGFLLERIVESTSCEVYGVDAATEAIKICRKKGFEVIEADVEKLIPFEDNFFDAVTGLEVIEHLADTDNFLIEVKRVLKKDGFLILTTPNFFSLARRVMTMTGINPYLEASFTYPPHMAGHLRFYTHDLLEKYLEYSGFKVLVSTSDVINFSKEGKYFSKFLAKIFPKLGRGVVIKAINIK
jgi:methionine biosynthesis protein MetW